MPTRTAFVLTIGDVIESGPPTVTPSNRRNASAPNSPSSETLAGANVHYKRSVSTSSKVNGRIGGASRGRPNGHQKQNSKHIDGVNGRTDFETKENDNNCERTFVHSINTNKDISNGCMSDSENSNDSGDLLFSTTESNGKKNARRIARMKTRHVSTSSATSITNGNSQPSPLALANKPKKSIMKTSRLSQDEDEEVSFSDSATITSQCNGSSPSGPANSKVGVRKRKTAAEKFLEDNADYYGIQVLPSKLRNHSYISPASSSKIPLNDKWHSHNSDMDKASCEDKSIPDLDSFSTSMCVSSTTTWITVGCRRSSNNSLNLHESTNHSSRPSRSNSMDLGVVGTATTSILQAALIQDDKSLIWPGHVQDREKSAERRRYRYKSCNDQYLQEHLNSGSIDLDDIDSSSAQDSPSKHSVISNNSQSTSLPSPYATRKRLSSSCVSNGGTCITDNEDDSSHTPYQTKQYTTKKNSMQCEGSEVETENLDEGIANLGNNDKRKRKTSDCSEGFNKRKRNESESAEIDSTRKRRTELDKLLDAGSSSFHFETAKQTAERLGPIHIDVDNEKETSENSDEEEESLSEAEKRRPPGWLTIPSKKKKNPKDSRGGSKKQRLLKKVSPGNSASKNAGQAKITNFFPRTVSGRKVLSPKSIPPPPKRNRGKFVFKKLEVEGTEDESDSNETSQISYVSPSLLQEMEDRLSLVNGSEVPVDSLRFSFENTPAREGWFLTYTRQDQGDEILYYPEPKSFPLPYEMPASTFYPRKEKCDSSIETGRGKGKCLGSKNSSRNTSVNPSGTVTPVYSSQVGAPNQEMELYSDKGKANSIAAALAASSRLKEALTTSRKTRGGKGDNASLSTISLSNHLERKSPRGHASTKSLISAALGGCHTDSALELSADTFDCNETNILPLNENQDMAESKQDLILKNDLDTMGAGIDECSNDSWAHSEYGISNKLGGGKTGNRTIPAEEDVKQFQEISQSLDSFFFEGELAMLDGTVNPPATSDPTSPNSTRNSTENTATSDTTSTSRQTSRQRQRSSGSSNSTDKPAKAHKHHKHNKSHDKNKHRNKSEQMDHVVASNVDSVLLDCLEDELPSGIVAIEGEIPGSTPLELLNSFEGCDSMIYARSSRKWTKPRPFQEHSSTDKKAELRAVFGGRGIGYLSPSRMRPDDYEHDDTKHHFHSSISESTILKRLLTDGLPSMNGNQFPRKNSHKLSSDGLMLPPPPVNDADDGPGYSSSEDTASVCSSVLTTGSHSSDASGPTKRKKKRNLTGFPSPKKKKKKIQKEVNLKQPAGKAPRVKLLTAVLTQNAKKAANAKKNIKVRSPGRKGRLAKSVVGKSGRWQKSSLRSTRQDASSCEDESESDASEEASDEDVSDSESESNSTPKRGRPRINFQKKQPLKPKKATKTPKKLVTEWQQAKAAAKEKALAENKTKLKNVKPKKIVVSRKKYAEYKKAKMAEAAAAAAQSAEASRGKRASPNKNIKSPSGGTKTKKHEKSPKSNKAAKNDDEIEEDVNDTSVGVGKDGEEESVHADAEDEESEEECENNDKESRRPAGWLTVPKRQSPKKNIRSNKGKANTRGRVALKKPKLRNANLRSKQNTSIKGCRLT